MTTKIEESPLPPTNDEVNTICKEIFEEAIGQAAYNHVDAMKWNNRIVETVTSRLVSLNRPYKYCLTCVIMQGGHGSGLNIATTCYWDKSSDVTYSVRWESKSVVGVCTIFAVNYVSSHI